MVLSKPVSRWELVAGRFVGMSATLGLMIACMASLHAAVLLLVGGYRPEIWPAMILTELTATVDGISWSGAGFPNSHLFYAKGMQGAFDGKPFMVLAFRASQPPDNREFTLSIVGWAEMPGVIDPKSFELIFSGAASGKGEESQIYNNFGTDAPPLRLEITKWEATGDTATTSGTLSGTLKCRSGAPDSVFEHATFTDVRVTVYRDAY